MGKNWLEIRRLISEMLFEYMSYLQGRRKILKSKGEGDAIIEGHNLLLRTG